MLLAKERLAAVDSLCPSTVPREGAREEQIQRVEERLGRRLPSSYRSFLRHANGWDAFFQTIDLPSCEELLGGPHQDYARLLFSGLAAEDWAALGLDPERLLVIGVTLEDRDVLALDLARPTEPRECYVVWLAGEKIEEWPSFAECFQS